MKEIIKRSHKRLTAVRAALSVLLVAVLLFAGCTAQKKPQEMSIPDFTVYDLSGQEVHLSDFMGKPIVLNFWASWCGPCKMEMPDFQQKYLEVGEDVQFLMINLTDGSSETVDSATGFVTEMGYTFPVYYDQTLSAANAYKVYSIPTTYFIDADGTIVTQSVGAIDAETLQRNLDMILQD